MDGSVQGPLIADVSLAMKSWYGVTGIGDFFSFALVWVLGAHQNLVEKIKWVWESGTQLFKTRKSSSNMLFR